MKDHASANLLLPRSPAPRSRQAAAPPATPRFSPLSAPQRALIDRFIAEARPWALRQARKSYRHLPPELHEQAFEQAVIELRTGAPAGTDRRTLYVELAEALDGALRRIHVGWCLNQSRDTFDAQPSGPLAPSTGTHPVERFVADGLGGLERAVLQLEIGAGRDTNTTRAALRLGPRQYARHRELGLGKLRGAIAGQLAGTVCDHHLQAVTLAATGDGSAAARLESGPERCRSCAREAAGLQRLLHQRLAIAPWPLAIKPAAIIAAKLGALGTVFGGKGAAGGAVATSGTTGGLKAVAAVLATAAVASGGVAAVDSASGPLPTRTASEVIAPAAATTSTRTTAVAGAPAERRNATATTKRRRSERTAAPKRRQKPSRSTAQSQSTTQAPAATATGGGVTTTASDPVRTTTHTVKKTVDDTVAGVKRTVTKVRQKLPKVPTVSPTDPVGSVRNTVDELTKTVDGLLKP